MSQLGKILVGKFALVTITQLNGIYLWEILSAIYPTIHNGRLPRRCALRNDI